MKSRILFWAVIFGLLAVLVGVTACSGSGYSNSTPTNTSAASTGNSITLANFAFSPATITIKVGTVVTWTNKDPATHTVTSDSGAFESGNMANNATYSYTFTKAGTFTYHCAIHTNMKGSVIVQ